MNDLKNHTFESKDSSNITTQKCQNFINDVGDDIAVVAQTTFYDRHSESYKTVIFFYE